MMRFLRNRALRLPIIALAVIGWLSLTDHCAIAVIKSSPKSQPMPSCHESSERHHIPTKEKGCDFECCKLRATPPQFSDGLSSSYHTQFVPITYPGNHAASAIFIGATLLLELDTGPPFVTSFAESVLQRSILAHAPPFSA